MTGGIGAGMEFEQAMDVLLKQHMEARRRSGRVTAADRIKDGLGHAEALFLENVWWPAFHEFGALHPEYQIFDFKESYRYIDFAYIHEHFRVAIEIDGSTTHWKEVSDWSYADHCQRQNHLVIDRWNVMRFAYVDVRNRPRVCQQTLQQLLGRLAGDVNHSFLGLNLLDREIVRLAMGLNRTITVRDVIDRVQLTKNAAIQHLHHLHQENWLEPASGSVRIRSYRVHPSRWNCLL